MVTTETVNLCRCWLTTVCAISMATMLTAGSASYETSKDETHDVRGRIASVSSTDAIQRETISQQTKTNGVKGGHQLRFSIGNTSVLLMMEVWGSPFLQTLQRSRQIEKLVSDRLRGAGLPEELSHLFRRKDELVQKRDFKGANQLLDEIVDIVNPSGDPLPPIPSAFETHEDQLRTFLEGPDTYGQRVFPIEGIEDYVGWGVVEQEEGKWNWEIYKQNVRKIKDRGYLYIPYGWVQNLPGWVRNNPDYGFASRVGRTVETEALDIFCPKTWEAYDRFYGQMREKLGDDIDMLRVGSPYDYGETAYPAKAADWAFPMRNSEAGFWVDSHDARDHFMGAMQKKYGSIERLNRAWRTGYGAFSEIDYPKDATIPRYWLDFVNWYHEGFTEMMGKLLGIVRTHFPDTPIAISLGWPFEKINLGQDLTGLVNMAASHRVIIRTPAGPYVPVVYTKRVATAVRHYGLPGFSSEPVDGSAPLKDIAKALFADLTTAVNWHFDYLANMQRGRDLFQHYRNVWRGVYPEIDMALLFPTTSQRLENWDTWRNDSFEGGYPEGLMAFVENLRDIVDFDVVDENLIRDGVLTRYRCMVWSSGRYVERDILGAILDWVKTGGILLVTDLNEITVLDEDGGKALADVRRPLGGDKGMMQYGTGYVYDARGDSDALIELTANRGDLKRLDEKYPASLTRLPPLDSVPDGVHVSLFKDGILLFNTTEDTVIKHLPNLSDRSWELSYKNLPSQIELSPLTIRWVDGTTGEVL